MHRRIAVVVPAHCVPQAVVLLSTLPVNDNGKVICGAILAYNGFNESFDLFNGGTLIYYYAVIPDVGTCGLDSNGITRTALAKRFDAMRAKFQLLHLIVVGKRLCEGGIAVPDEDTHSFDKLAIGRTYAFAAGLRRTFNAHLIGHCRDVARHDRHAVDQGCCGDEGVPLRFWIRNMQLCTTLSDSDIHRQYATREPNQYLAVHPGT